MDPLDPGQHPDQLVNIYSGKIATESVNVDDALAIGTQQMKDFESELPAGFHNSIKKNVKTMLINKKSIKIKDVEIYNTETIYARVMALISTGALQLDEVFKYELSPIPVSLFEESGDMRLAKNKSMIKRSLRVLSSQRLQSEPDMIVIDGSALFYTVH